MFNLSQSQNSAGFDTSIAQESHNGVQPASPLSGEKMGGQATLLHTDLPVHKNMHIAKVKVSAATAAQNNHAHQFDSSAPTGAGVTGVAVAIILV